MEFFQRVVQHYFGIALMVQHHYRNVRMNYISI